MNDFNNVPQYILEKSKLSRDEILLIKYLRKHPMEQEKILIEVMKAGDKK